MSYARNSTRVDGRKLRQIREAIGWTQETAGERSGYSCRLIRKLERGGPVELQTLQNILGAYSEQGSTGDPLPIHGFMATENTADAPKRQAADWLIEAFSANLPAEWMAAMSEDVTLYAAGETLHGKQSVHDHFKRLANLLQPAEITIDYLLNDEHAVSLLWTIRTRHDGKLLKTNTEQEQMMRGSTLVVFNHDKQIELLRDHRNG